MAKVIYNPTKLYDADINDLVESSIPSEELEKARGGEGSRGGKIIGRTKSGKPIYESGKTKGLAYKDEDRRDAAEAHNKQIKELREKEKQSMMGGKNPDATERKKLDAKQKKQRYLEQEQDAKVTSPTKDSEAAKRRGDKKLENLITGKDQIKKAVASMSVEQKEEFLRYLEGLSKAKIVTRQGRRFYADGPSKGKEVGTVRGKGRKQQAEPKKKEEPKKESGYGAGDRMAELRDAGMGKEPEKKQAEAPKKDKNVEMGSKALREAGYPELADKLNSGEMSKEDAADWAEDRNFHGIAAMLRADENTDLRVLENAEQAHNDFDLGPRDQSYEGERDGALNAKYEAANYEPLKDMKEGRFGKEWAARRKMDAALYLMENGLEDSDTFKKLKKDFTDSENTGVANKTLKELVNDSDRSTGMWLRLSQDPSSDFEPERSRQIAKESAQRAVKLLKLGKKFDLDT